MDLISRFDWLHEITWLREASIVAGTWLAVPPNTRGTSIDERGENGF
ncbi:MAG TPA: hypothetical protein VK550_00595 [Polyangiaceae bacterium]|nr:hypothetical protein [Polyangiaceae bacterium]